MPANVEGMNPEFRSRLMALINASGGRVTINSGYRSIEEQTRLWNAAVAKYGPQAARRWVAPPGHSNHNHGIAADLGGDLDWAHANASRFGLYWPMEWEPWHIELSGSRGGPASMERGMTTPPPSMQPKQNDIVQGLEIVASLIPGATEGQAPTIQTLDNMTTMDDQPDQDQDEMVDQQGMGDQVNPGGDVMEQLRAGFRAVGRNDLAEMVGGPDFGAWVNAESGWDPEAVSPANNQGKANGGLFQFWFGHKWAAPYAQGGRFTMSPFEQAQVAATRFNLTPDRIRKFAAQIRSGSYRGWG